METPDPARAEAFAQQELHLTPEAARKRALPDGLFAFTHLTANEENNMDTTNPKAIAHSHTSIDTFQTCPKQYHAKYITKEVKFQETEATMYGNRMHKGMEQRLWERVQLPAEFMPLEPLAQKVLGLAGRLTVEEKLAMTVDGKAVPFFDPSVWMRGLADAMIWDAPSKYLRIFDWKTGKPKKDMQQLEIMTLLGKVRYPDAAKFRVSFVYTKTGDIDKEDFTAEQLPEMYDRVKRETDRIEVAVAKGEFPPTPNGLCKNWCQVTSCEFHGKGRYG